MLDIETLSVMPNAVVLTLGAVKFDPYSDADPHTGLYSRLNVDEQLALGRAVDNDTLDWWSKQEAHIRDEALGDEDRISVEAFLHELRRYVVGVNRIFCQGPVFDIVILENLFRQYKLPILNQLYGLLENG